MKLKLYFFLLAFISLNFSKAQNYDHVYSKVIGIYQQSSWTSGQEYEIENFSNFSKCHTNINVNYTFDLETGGNGTIKMYAVNGSGENLINTINVTDSPTSNSFNVPANLLPIEGFLIKWTIGNTTSSNFIFESFTLTATSPEGTMPSNPLVEDVYYTVGQLANALTANGTNLIWYTSNSGGMPITTAPIPNTNASSVTTYYVTQSDFTGCESKRQAINVYVGDSATHLNFDGVNDYVQVPSGINLANSSFTVEFYAKRNTTNTDSYILTQGFEATNNLLHIGFRNNNDFTFAFWYNDINIPATNYVADNEWHHWSCVYNMENATKEVYQDGVLVGASAVPAPYTGNGILQIGVKNSSQYFFNGNLDDIRIWNVAKTADQVSASKNCELQGDEAGLIAYYQFNEGLDANENAAFTTLNDATINANNGSLTNFALTGNTSNWLAGSPVVSGSIVPSEAIVSSPVIYTQNDSAMPLTATLGANGSELVWYTPETGQVGSTTAPTPSTTAIGATSYWVTSTNANGCESEKTEIIVNVMAPATHLSFDGVDDYVNINIGTFTTQNLNYTHEFWFKTTSANSTIFNFSDTGMPNSGGFNKTIYLQSGNLVSYVYNNTENYITSTATFNDNNWHHVTEIVTFSERRLYVDGTLIGTDTSFSNQNFGYIVLGASNITPGLYFEGEIDEVRIWNTALSIDDVNSTGNCQLEGDEANLLAYYQFNQGTDATDNTSVTTLIDATTNAYNGNLINFGLTGNTSNWLAGSPIGIAPIVTSQPQNQTITETDDTVVFTVSATNVSSYQWEVFFEDGDGEGGTWMPLDDSLTNPDVSGSTTNTLTISGDNLSFIVGLQFRVVMNGTASCNVISNEVNVTDETLSVSTVLINEVKVFPNPTTDNVKISLSKVQDFEISVYDLNGRLLLNSKNRSDAFLLDLSSYQNGIYIIKTKIDQKEAINRVIKH
ncbi:LamG-like jellyroll fold domain-containing protein [Olleya marilimosa]|uniref:T9SS type A sorting domain-containing protein n=1 Tax=Olleya marilimosa TaxID=272164 RepID=A0ABR8LZJ6_9FLAO|nr:LamG-like jellyroll fold domain-containing protein [Olleya marilimosa]MBD3863677.1 T9SS type A sorting domain-containing protein [Olleya marilimosa]